MTKTKEEPEKSKSSTSPPKDESPNTWSTSQDKNNRTAKKKNVSINGTRSPPVGKQEEAGEKKSGDVQQKDNNNIRSGDEEKDKKELEIENMLEEGDMQEEEKINGSVKHNQEKDEKGSKNENALEVKNESKERNDKLNEKEDESKQDENDEGLRQNERKEATQKENELTEDKNPAEEKENDEPRDNERDAPKQPEEDGPKELKNDTPEPKKSPAEGDEKFILEKGKKFSQMEKREDTPRDEKEVTSNKHKYNTEENTKNTPWEEKEATLVKEKNTPEEENKAAPEKEKRGIPTTEEKDIPKHERKDLPTEGVKGALKGEKSDVPQVDENSTSKQEEKSTLNNEEKGTPKDEDKATPKDEGKEALREEEKTIPKDGDKATPKEKERVTSKGEEQDTLKEEEKKTTKDEERSTPEAEEKEITPKQDEKATPKVEEKDSPKEEEKATVREEEEEKDTPKDEEKDTPKDEEKDTPKDENATPNDEDKKANPIESQPIEDSEKSKNSLQIEERNTSEATVLATANSEVAPAEEPKPEPPPSPKFLDEPTDSPSQREWKRQKRDGARNEAIDNIMDLIGQEDVKCHVLRVKGRVETARKQEIDLSKDRFSIAFIGNRGTGKTAIAGLYAQFLLSLDIIPGKGALAKKASRILYTDGVAGVTRQLKELGETKGGIYTVEKPYQLVPHKSYIEHMLSEIKSYQGKAIFIFTGSAEEMPAFLGYNETVRSRVPDTISLVDYSDAELLLFFKMFIETRFNKKMEVDDGVDGPYVKILIKQLSSKRGNDGFTNIRAVEDAFLQVCQRQAERLHLDRIAGKSPEYFITTRADLIGAEPQDALEKSAAWKELQEMIGLEHVKEAVKALSHRAQDNYRRSLQGKKPLSIGLNRVFLGPPGTGKTTVAKLYGRLLADLGLLPSGEVMIKTPADLIASYIGHTEAKTTRILNAAMGKVLIIDEVHMLYPGKRNASSGSSGSTDIFRIAAIDTIVTQTQNKENRCILLVGYAEPILEMFQSSNPGLPRRFPLEDAIVFTDFNIHELTQILDKKVRDQGLEMSKTARKVAIQLLRLAQDRPNFGNGGDVENLIDRAKASRQRRLLSAPPPSLPGSSVDLTDSLVTIKPEGKELTSVPPLERSDSSINLPPSATILGPEDFDVNFNRVITRGNSCRELFQGVIGCEDIIRRFEGYQRMVQGMRKFGIDPRPHIPFTYIFKGPPGTGKTTIARKVGQIFYEMGFLSTPTVIECSVTDMIGEYTGQTGPKIINLFERSLGKVLFVDEAYRLGQNDHNKDATSELVDCITKTRYANKIIIILAGYEEDMNNLIHVNRGLASRFPTEITFHSMSPEDCLELLEQRVGELGVTIHGLNAKIPSEQTKRVRAQQFFSKLAATTSWGNGRDVETLAKSVIGHAYMGSVLDASKEGNLSISFDELCVFMEKMLDEKKKRVATKRRLGRFNFFSQTNEAAQSIVAPPPDEPEAVAADPEAKYEVDNGQHAI